MIMFVKFSDHIFLHYVQFIELTGFQVSHANIYEYVMQSIYFPQVFL